MDLCGKPVIERVLDRVRKANYIDDIIVAAPHPINCSATVNIGSEDDVLERYYFCAKENFADVIVRITSDCPLVEPFLIDLCVFNILNYNLDYVACIEPYYPDGLDVEVFTMNTLERAYNKARKQSDREHVTPFMRRDKLSSMYIISGGFGKEKVSIDTKEDLERVRKLWNGRTKQFS